MKEGVITVPYSHVYVTPEAAIPRGIRSRMGRGPEFYSWFNKMNRRQQQVWQQDHPYSRVRIVAKVHREGDRSVLYFEVMIGRYVEMGYVAESQIKEIMDKELKKRKLVRVERPFIHDDFCYHARAIRLSDWKKWMKRGTACRSIAKQTSPS